MVTRTVQPKITKRSQVVESLKQEILEGDMKSGDAVDSEFQLCKRFNVSRGLMRQSLAELERQRILVSVQGKGRFVSQYAHALESSSINKQIRVLVDSWGTLGENFCLLEIMKYLNDFAAKKGLKKRIAYEFHSFHDDPCGERTIDALAEEADGLVVIPFSRACCHAISSFTSRHCPVVSFFLPVSSPSVYAVSIDQESGAFLATKYLISCEHKRIGLLHVPVEEKGGVGAEGRLSGYKKAIRKAGIEFQPEFICSTGVTPSDIRHSIERLLGRPDRPTALIVGGGLLTKATLNTISDMGLRVPDDISVIAFDDVPEAAMYEPPLSVVRQPLGRCVEIAMRQLFSLIENPAQKKESYQMQMELVLRGSVADAVE